MTFIPRPSGAGQWIRCNGAPKLQALYPEDRDSEAAREGTAAHWARAEVLNGRAVAVGQITDAGFVLTEEMVEAAEASLRRVHARITAHGGEQPTMFVEHPLRIDRVHELCAGTVDLAMYFPAARALYVDDFKFGFDWVEVFENWQLLCYTAGLLQLLNLEGRTNDLRLVLGVDQPRSFHPDGAYRSWETTPAEARPYVAQLNAAARAVMGGEPTLQVNPACTNCSARIHCPSLLAAGHAAKDRRRAAVPFDMPAHAMGLELAEVRASIKALEALETGLTAQVEALITRGERVPFWSLERKPGRLAWVVPPEQVVALADMLGAPIAPRKPLTPTQAAEFLPPGTLDGFAARPAGAAKLVPLDDKSARKIFS